MTVVWIFQYEAFGNNIMSLAFHEENGMVGSLSQLDLESFKFSKIGICEEVINICDDGTLVEILRLWTLSIVLFHLKNTVLYIFQNTVIQPLYIRLEQSVLQICFRNIKHYLQQFNAVVMQF
jgi:hypothetical protein